ncbi:MAG: hypothetical protein CM1200mP9_12430 [Gammaproteobacteria bacterium]|nr:MAG: hypothetical protein CM1200mP9_12430 [Gammaproteobacteria bacterium]
MVDWRNPKPIVILVLGPHIAELGDDFLGEQLGRTHALVLGHVAYVDETENVANA